MGVKNLWDILDSCKKTLPLHHLQNKRVCIDLSCWMVQLQLVCKSHCPLKDKLYLKGLFHRLRALIALNCRLVFVTDGSIPALKVSTYRRRLNIAPKVSKDEDICKATALKRNMGSEFSCMVKEAKILGLALGIPCLDGVEEAEAQCALLNSASLCDGCFSSDSDIFLFGAKTVYREICIGEGGYVVCYDMEDIQNKLGFGRNSLIALALLLGCDYSRGVHGIGPDAACQFIKSIGEDAILQHLASEGISSLKKSKTSKKPTKVVESDNKENCLNYISKNNGTMRQPQNNQFSEVINVFLNPKCHHADSDTVYRALSVHPFQQIKLQQICAQFLEWPPEKTEVAKKVHSIIDKFAERGLRSLGIARQEVPDGNKDSAGGPWEFVALLPLFDPPHHDSAETIRRALDLGVSVKMITGDQLAIGKETGRRLGIGTNMYPASALIGEHKEIIDIPIDERIEKADGFTGAFPEHKYEIVRRLEARKHICGMTGDGVNDAPALKKADIGIDVAASTDAARSASDIVLTEPGLSVIISAL